jgi:hypothetical protein
MRKTLVSGAVSIVAAFGQQSTALSQLRAITGADKVARHDMVVSHVGTIIALALAKQPAAGFGNPADHGKVAQVFSDAGMTRYADACIGLSVAIKTKGHRSVAEWDDAMIEGFAMADAMLAELRPKVYTKAEQKKREETKLAKQATREAEAKAEEAAAKEATAKALSDAYVKGQQEAPAPVITAQMVADMIQAGTFQGDDLALIVAALESVRQSVDQSVTA